MSLNSANSPDILLATRNATINPAAAAGTAQQVTGQAAFWAIMALALNTMTQESTYGTRILGSAQNFEGSLVPHRSSPIICLLDAGLELAALMRLLSRASRKTHFQATERTTQYSADAMAISEANPKLLLRMSKAAPTMQLPPYGDAYPKRQLEETAAQQSTTNQALLTMRVAVFVLGVLPQSIKLFSMQGIPVTQACAAVFLFSTAIRALTSALRARVEDDIAEIIEWLQGSPWRCAIFLISPLLVSLLHIAAYFELWRLINTTVTISVSQNHCNMLDWIRLIMSLAFLACFLWYLLRLPYSLFSTRKPVSFSWILTWLLPTSQTLDIFRSAFRTPESPRAYVQPLVSDLTWNITEQSTLGVSVTPGGFIDRLFWPCWTGLAAAGLSLVLAKLMGHALRQFMTICTPTKFPQEPNAPLETGELAVTFLQNAELPETSRIEIEEAEGDVGLSNMIQLTSEAGGAGSRQETLPGAAAQEMPPTYPFDIVRLILGLHDPRSVTTDAQVCVTFVILRTRSWRLSDEEQTKILSAWKAVLISSRFTAKDDIVWPSQDGLFTSTRNVPTETLAQLSANFEPFSRAHSSVLRVLQAVWIVCAGAIRLGYLIALLVMFTVLEVYNPFKLLILATRYARTQNGSNYDTLWIAFAIFNLLTAVLCYIVIFDGQGTYNPGWTSVFG